MTSLNTRKSIRSDVNPTSRDTYDKFVKTTGRTDISYEMYTKIILKVNEKVVDKAITGRYAVRFPKLGILSLVKVTPTKLVRKIDWGRYHKDGVYTTFKNFHSDGMMYRLFFYLYERKNTEFGFYNFLLSRSNRQLLATKVINDEVQ
jgi:hypothetical protein